MLKKLGQRNPRQVKVKHIESMKEIISLVLFNYFFAMGIIAYGLWHLRDTIKNTPRYTNSALQPFLNGIAGSIFLIIVGVLIIYFKLVGDL